MGLGLQVLLTLIAGIGFGIVSGSEIAMLTLAATAEYRWHKAWLITFAGLATMVPVAALIYYFFTVLPAELLGVAAGIVIFVIGAYLFGQGIMHKAERLEEEGRAGAGVLGIYAGVVLEGTEILTVVVSLGIATSQMASSISGLIIGWALPLATVGFLRSFIEKLTQRTLKVAVGVIMMAMALGLVLLHLP